MGIKQLGTAIFLVLFTLSLTACKKEEPKVQKTEPVKVVFDSTKAKNLALERIVSVDVDVPALPTNSDYIRIMAGDTENGGTPDGFLSGITSDDTRTVVLLVQIQNGPELKLPAVPLFLFEKEGPSWTKTFQATGELTPYFVAQRAPLTLSVEMVLLKDKLEGLARDANELVTAYGTTLALYSNEGAHEISTLADAFAQRIALVEEASITEIGDFTLPYLENYGSAINLLNAAGEIASATQLSVQGRTSVLPLHHNTPPAYSDLLSYQIGLHSPRSALADLEASFWSVPADVLRPSCQAIHGALKERLGLSERDSALVLWSMIQPHSLFATGIDYRSQCSGEDMAALLSEIGFSLPAQQAIRPNSKTLNAMNKSLSSIARLLKNAKDGSEAKLQNIMADTVLIRDQARMLFTDDPDQVISSTSDVIAPTLASAEAADYLLALPIQSYGCYARGTGQSGHHRASLVQLENDPSLWLLDFSFNQKNVINGIQLRSASQRDFCRAIGGRKGKNRCVFSGKSFPGLTPDKCG